MADTLLSIANDELARVTSEQLRLGTALSQARLDLTSTQTALGNAVDTLKQQNDDAAAIRRQIANTTSAADGDALFAELTSKIADIRASEATIAGLQEQLADAQSRVNAGQDQSTAAAAEVRSLTDAQKAAASRDAADQLAANLAGSMPLSGIPAASDVNAAGDAKTAADNAKARLRTTEGGDLPDALFDRADARWKRVAARQQAVSDQQGLAEDAQAAALDGLAQTTAQTRLAFERAEQALQDFVGTAVDRRTRALALLTGIAGGNALSADEKASLVTLAATATTENAFSLENDRDNAQTALDQHRDAIAAARLAAIAADPTQDPDQDAAVAALLADTSTQTDLDAKNTAYTAAARDAMNALDAAVPDWMWGLFADYETALGMLADLNAITPATLVSDLNNTEAPYADALKAEKDNARSVSAVAEVVGERTGRVTTVGQTGPARLLQALRGNE
jgi:hypothetical protein